VGRKRRRLINHRLPSLLSSSSRPSDVGRQQTRRQRRRRGRRRRRRGRGRGRRRRRRRAAATV
jgi:hypothetical protein